MIIAIAVLSPLVIAAGYASLTTSRSAARDRRRLRAEQDRERQLWRNERADLIGMADEAKTSLIDRAARDRLAMLERFDRQVGELQRLADVRLTEADGRVAELLDRLEQTQEHHRSEMRELLNRLQHPHLVPTGTAPATPPRPDRTASEAARAAWVGVGTVAPLQSPNGAAPDDELGSDLP